ncbi:hypothetical protein DFH28DRAFT_903142 [Melampsora americana]|nr:hypothetical protein DFH28DRAFT_903142 [Melampsora americana]
MQEQDPPKEMLLLVLLEATPPNKNPFIDGVQALVQRSLPHVPAYSYRVLIFFMVVYGAIALVALFLILFPLLKSPEMRKKHLWLWNKCYIGCAGTTPFYIPNNSLSIAVGLSIASSLCSPYRNLKQPKKFMHWLKFFTSPLVLNGFCILIPLLVTLKTIYWTIAQCVATGRVWAHVDLLAKLFQRAAKEWSPTVAIDPSSEAMQELEQVMKHNITLLRRVGHNVRLASIQWNVCIFVLSAFYFLTTGALLLLVRRSLKIALGKLSVLKGERNSDMAHSGPESKTNSDVNMDIMINQGSTASAHLQRGYIWVSRIGSVFMAVAMLLKSRQIYNTKDLHQESQEYTVMCMPPKEPTKQWGQFGATLWNCPTTDASSDSAERYCETSLETSHVAKHRWMENDVNERMDSDHEKIACVPPDQICDNSIQQRREQPLNVR